MVGLRSSAQMSQPSPILGLFFLSQSPPGRRRRGQRRLPVSLQVRSLRRVGGAADGLAVLRWLGEEEGDVDDAGAAGGSEAADERRRGSSQEERDEV